MATKAELVSFAQSQGLDVDGSMLKSDIEAALRDAGYDENLNTEEDSVAEDRPTDDRQTREGGTPEQPDEGGVDIQQIQEQGYQGTRPDVHDDAEYALPSGPDSPGATEDPENPGHYLVPEVVND